MIHIRRSDQQRSKEFYTTEVTAEFLMEAFKLESMPKFLEAASTGLIVQIIPSNLVANEFYIVEGPGRNIVGSSRSENSNTGMVKKICI